MGLFDMFKKKNKIDSEKFEIKNIEFINETNSTEISKSNLQYNNIDILIKSNKKESLKHIEKDYEVLITNGIEKLIKTSFIPWLKGDKFKDLDDEKIYNGLKLTNISYSYHRIIDKYSPTKKSDFFGEFEFYFVSSNKYTENLLQASAFVVLINNNKIYYDRNYDM